MPRKPNRPCFHIGCIVHSAFDAASVIAFPARDPGSSTLSCAPAHAGWRVGVEISPPAAHQPTAAMNLAGAMCSITVWRWASCTMDPVGHAASRVHKIQHQLGWRDEQKPSSSGFNCCSRTSALPSSFRVMADSPRSHQEPCSPSRLRIRGGHPWPVRVRVAGRRTDKSADP